MQQRTMAVGIFDDHASAERALQALRDEGVEPSQIGVAALQQGSVGAGGAPAEHHQIRVDETTGILAGGLLGGVAGWLLGAATVAVPGLGALVAAGALVGALGGAGIGAAAGGLVGHLVDAGLSHEEARYYHERVHGGAVLVTVHTTADHADRIRSVLQAHGGHDFHTRRPA
jgi:hypothetical protein